LASFFRIAFQCRPEGFRPSGPAVLVFIYSVTAKWFRFFVLPESLPTVGTSRRLLARFLLKTSQIL
jgi:hypothetical protein